MLLAGILTEPGKARLATIKFISVKLPPQLLKFISVVLFLEDLSALIKKIMTTLQRYKPLVKLPTIESSLTMPWLNSTLSVDTTQAHKEMLMKILSTLIMFLYWMTVARLMNTLWLAV